MGRRLEEVLSVLEERAPLALAEAWDNVGLLIEPSASDPVIERVLLTIDLTMAVLEEALEARAELVVAYHPPIFGGLKRLRASAHGERVVVEALTRGLFVYAPHTALDAAEHGMTDWLARALGPGRSTPIVPSALPAFAGRAVGAGRRVELERPLRLSDAVLSIKAHLGLAHVRVAAAAQHAERDIASFAVCPGAGGSVFEKVRDVDLLLTGEMRHHDVLARVESGTSVVLAEHTNTERGYLSVFAEELRGRLVGVSVETSKRDKDPLGVS